MEETISLKEIFDILKKHVAAILISMFAGLALASVATFFIITPKYDSQAQLIVKLPRTDATNAGDVNTNLLMINTYKDMITGDLVMSTVKDRLESEYDLDKTVSELKGAIQVQQSQNSQMFSIVATDTKPVDAEHIANTTAKVFQENAKDVLDVDKISIISNAQASMTPVSPNNKLNLAIGLVLGMMVGVGFAFLLELLDRTVKDSRFVAENLGFTILGSVPQMTDKELKKITKSIAAVQNQDNSTTKQDKARRSRSRV
ncbi:tyrosine protein kinase [Enterococcus casseliflavus]|uniref:YveK family protein n=1 Tax=Enterococcus casseliflavus TaxID=37734 RepID=UPI001AD62AB0|nr:Wzz/FepE/Etk N-terminal domain-containing protein [Enterococcus casseliflavus]MBO6357938.1 tyrosine protein kinase [Enterococcus casseliflavus]MBO6375584.1 tyrosine protein kinase [Enterococcus casseliflavus]